MRLCGANLLNQTHHERFLTLSFLIRSFVDIQEYYANTGALKVAAENRKPINPRSGTKQRVAVSVIEAFGGTTHSGGDSSSVVVPVRDVEDVLRLEYRSKLLNPKWRDAILDQSSGGAYEVSHRMTAMDGWAATTDIDNFVFDQVNKVAKRLSNYCNLWLPNRSGDWIHYEFNARCYPTLTNIHTIITKNWVIWAHSSIVDRGSKNSSECDRNLS